MDSKFYYYSDNFLKEKMPLNIIEYGKINVFFRAEFLSCFRGIFFASVIFLLCGLPTSAQTTYFSPGTSNSGYIKSNVFRQEIARFEINVMRAGKAQLPITQVPRIQQGDVLKVKLLDEAINGIKLDQSNWDWTFLVTFINPNHRMAESDGGKAINDKSGPVSEEIQFKKSGWYREYSFTVPYDCQPVFFLYPKPKYRQQLVKVVSRKYEDLRKLGEKTIEIAGAYAQISSFLNELQMVLNRNAQIYGYTYNGNNPVVTNPTTPSYYPYNTYNSYSPYSTTPIQTTPTSTELPFFSLQTVPMMNQIVEGLARSFNITLPSCWGGANSSYGSTNTNSYGNYTSTYGSTSYGSTYTPTYGTTNTTGANTTSDFVNRAQCVAKNVNLEDFDVSVARMWQQGGVFLAAELQKRYPQLAYYINIAAAAIDFIVKAFQKSPLRIVPSIIQTSDNPANNNSYNSYNSYSSGTPGNSANQSTATPVKISLFAESQPQEGQFVTAYPIVVHKWQANPDPDVISLNPPVLSEPCLHAGQNILKNTDLSAAWSEDNYSRDFKLVMTSSNGFRKEFPLKKNIGLGGWELNITPDDMSQIPKINMTLESEMVGTRGFNEIKSPKFELPLSIGGSWEVTAESQKSFTVGGKRTITLRNTLGSCRCLQRVIYKPSFGGQFVFEAGNNPNNPNALQFSADGRQVSFDVDATNFQPGAGQLEIKAYGSDTQGQANQPPSNTINLKLYAAPPVITDVRARRGDREVLLTGERLEQIQSLNINGRRAIMKSNNGTGAITAGAQNSYPSQNQNPTQTQGYPTQNQLNSISATSTNSSVSTAAVTQPQTPTQYQNISPNQRVAVFDDATTRINSDTITFDLTLDDNRPYQMTNRFQVGASRPSIKANEVNEIEGTFFNSSISNTPSNPAERNNQTTSGQTLTAKENVQQIELGNYPVVASSKAAMTVPVQNVLTDYNFKLENLAIETRIENSASNSGALPQVKFDVLDTNNMRLIFTFNQETNKYLSGRRLQFRIHDRERGDSDWYTIKQTFIRIPAIESIKCANEMNSQCEVRGNGLDYIAQISTDGGRTWFPQGSDMIQVQLTEDGKTKMLIPELINKSLLQIKLRDYPKTDGLLVSNFVFANTIKKTVVKPAKSAGQNQIVTPSSVKPIPNTSQPINQMPNGVPNQSNQPNQNQIVSSDNTKQNQPLTDNPKREKPKGKTKY